MRVESIAADPAVFMEGGWIAGFWAAGGPGGGDGEAFGDTVAGGDGLGGGRNGFAGLFPGQAFEQLDVMAVVAGDGFEDGLEGEGAAFGVGGRSDEVGGLNGGEEADVPGAEGLVGGLGGGEVEGGVAVAPAVLVEGLEGRAIGGEGLADAPAPDDLTVGEVGHELAQAPLIGAGGAVDLIGRIRGEEIVEPRRGGGDDVDGVVAFEVMGVGIFFHANDATTVVSRCCAGR